MKYIIALTLLIMVFLPCTAAIADDNSRTRDLVFESDEQLPVKPEADKQAVVAVKTIIELDRNGEKTAVLPSSEFMSGDKVKFIYTTNIDCYVYWLSQGSSGAYIMLFPGSKAGMDNWVKKNQSNTIPVKGTFKFDSNAGKEKIVLVMSPEKIAELETAANEASTNDGKVASTVDSVNIVTQQTEAKRQTRDLIFDEEENKETGISTKAQVSSDIKQPFVAYYELIHK